MGPQLHTADVLASGIHDAKNRLLEISGCALAGHDADRIQHLVRDVAFRLDRTLTAYRLLNDECVAAAMPVFVPMLVEDVLVRIGRIKMPVTSDIRFHGEWPLSRGLVEEALINALQNAGRYAASAVLIRAFERDGMLVFEVNDDGPGFPGTAASGRGVGLFIAQRIAQLHCRQTRAGETRHGRLTLANGGELGGALFALELP